MKKQIESIFANYQVQISNSYPSIYTKEDVMKLMKDMLGDIQQLDEPKSNFDFLNEKFIIDTLSSMDLTRYVETDNSSAEFDINYGNTIELSYVPVEVDDHKLGKDIFAELEHVLLSKQTDESHLNN
jgi:hypothetical protein